MNAPHPQRRCVARRGAHHDGAAGTRRALLGGDPASAAPWIDGRGAVGYCRSAIAPGTHAARRRRRGRDEAGRFRVVRARRRSGQRRSAEHAGPLLRTWLGHAQRAPSCAAIWYARAAECGRRLGAIQSRPSAISTETASRAIRDEAFRWYKRAADQGHPRAMSLVGRCCEEGWGTPRNIASQRATGIAARPKAAISAARSTMRRFLPRDGCEPEARLTWFDARAARLRRTTNAQALIAAWQTRCKEIVQPLRTFRLKRQQRALERQTAAIARQAAVRADHAMARNDQRDGIAAIGVAPRRAHRSESPARLAIAP